MIQMRQKPEPVLQLDENGQYIITREWVRWSVTSQGGYSIPENNDQVIIQFKGFGEITGLEEYTELTTLWLEGNGITQISGISHMTKLVMLYLQSNGIHTISGLDTFSQL